ncbi:hypothetical protein CEXT_486231 [Caerostris extrusa]|uniref:Uncharacterized protein n=1 Tax=Caerostris extrusa TaxID=172846 RepID=A0AAV4N448_CAEEX|nr:hypothetical protein CEXT_486231 [Caerostris extrusa]
MHLPACRMKRKIPALFCNLWLLFKNSCSPPFNLESGPAITGSLQVRVRETKHGNEFQSGKAQIADSDSVRAVVDNVVRSSTYSKNKVDVQKWLPSFRAQTNDITLSCLSSSARNKLSKIPEHVWVFHLLSGDSSAYLVWISIS